MSSFEKGVSKLNKHMKKRQQLISTVNLDVLRLCHLPQPTLGEPSAWFTDISCLFILLLWFAIAQNLAQTFSGYLWCE
ncbi:hypothetical protein HBI24_171870 [Parastagonospora nodorum]|nr:hypothetical protein HBI09_132300 [Parastagonospora nodorum]KAH4079614.1 hypothetical protein HBH48_216290 [Parastagonospora nodorum]KAH4086480.1 hypothetical protein HBH46_205480 [Parastagonospora nodorum]KAH4134833.1 hypothetical protein HBH45_157450 [Parastagonospora nodorum]KAH4155134.1 hypothetical protein HBH44_142830 [Parastagonospora nodorum]